MVEWPGRCAECGRKIDDWTDAGLDDGHWVHKACYSARWSQAQNAGTELPELRSPLERRHQLEMPMFFFLMLFHFGLGFAVIGWIMIDQDKSPDLGVLLLILGIIVPLVGIAGTAQNIVSRRRIELIREELDLAGGWKPGR